MKTLRLWICRALALGCLLACAEGLDDQYVRIYNLIQEADALVATGQKSQGRDKYLSAQAALRELRRTNPAWNEAVVQYRLNYISEKLRLASDSLEGAPTNTRPSPETDPIKILQEQVRQLTMQKEQLQSRLREALAAQPASVDPKEMSKSAEVIKELQKEVEVLKVRLGQAEARPDKPVSPAQYQQTQRALADAREKISDQARLISALNLEKEALQSQLLSAAKPDQGKPLTGEDAASRPQSSPVKKEAENPAALAALGRQIDGLRKELAVQHSRNEVLIAEKKILDERLERLEKSRDAELAAAKSELEAARAAALNERNAARSNVEEIERLKRESDLLRTNLDTAVIELHGALARLQEIEMERAGKSSGDLSVALVSGNRVGGKKNSGDSSKAPDSRTNTGLEISKQSGADPKSDQPRSGRDKDEDAINLAHLAAIQMDDNRLVAAERTLKEALVKQPGNPMSLLLLGELRVRQRDFEAALEPLSQAAQLDPQSAEAHNFLGLTLMEKGLRAPAESAMLRAVQLSPHYGDAHYNLAVFYVRQQPPSYELARQHYQQALDSGHSSDTNMERLLQDHPAASSGR